MLLIISLFMVIAYSIYFFVNIHLQNSKVDGTLAKCMPMVLGMTTSTTVGLLIARWMPEALAASTILSMIVSAGLAILIGKGFGVSGMMEAQAASLMGAMMGAMLGVMLSANEATVMVIVMDVIYLVSMFSVLLLLNKDFAIKKQSIFKTQSASFYLLFLLSICLIGTAGILQNKIVQVDAPAMSHNHEH